MAKSLEIIVMDGGKTDDEAGRVLDHFEVVHWQQPENAKFEDGDVENCGSPASESLLKYRLLRHLGVE